MKKDYPKLVGKGTLIDLLSDIGPVTDRLVSLLNIPDRIFLLSSDPPCFSSKPDEGAMSIASFFTLPTMKPRNAPDYALEIHSRGSHVFCTFVDKKRKIIVFDTIGGMYAEKGSWEDIERSVTKAIEAVAEYKSEGQEFEFVLVKEGLVSTISFEKGPR